MPDAQEQVYEFGQFRVDATKRLLFTREGVAVPLTPKAFDTLLYLLEHRERVLKKEELMKAIWPERVVEENNLNQNISLLRRVLGESRNEHRYIVTVPGHGFRFVADVRRAMPTREAGRARPWRAATGVTGILALGLLAAWFFTDRDVANSPAGNDELPSAAVAVQASVAVLPFADLSDEGDQDYFAQGIAEELLNRLARLEGLRVAGRVSSFSFQGSAADPRAIGETLGVANILEGSIRKEGGRVRIAARLVNAADGHQLWSRSFDRELKDIFAVQGEIATSVAGALSIALGVDSRNRLQGTGTASFEAYDAFLAGFAPLRKADPLGLDRAFLFLNRAVEIDPDYAEAWAALALFYIRSALYLAGEARQETLEKGHHAALSAVALDPDLAEPHYMLAIFRSNQRDWPGMEAELAKARALSANSTMAVAVAAMVSRVGQIGRALAYLNLTERYDPLHPEILFWNANFYTALGRRPEALATLVRFDSSGARPQAETEVHRLRLAIWSNDRNSAQLQQQVAKVAGLVTSPQSPFSQSILSNFYSSPSVLRELRLFHADTSRGPDPWLDVAPLAAYFGDPEWALDIMQEELLESPLRAWVLWMPVMSDMRRLPGFKDLVTELGLPPYWREYGWPEACHPVGADDFACG